MACETKRLQFDFETANGGIIPATVTLSIDGSFVEVTETEAFRPDGDELHPNTIKAIEEKAVELFWLEMMP